MDKYVTVIIDLTPVRDGTRSARLLDMVEGRSEPVFQSWLAGRDENCCNMVDVVAMDARQCVESCAFGHVDQN